jgi:CheY-like chemotaxis protein
MRILLADDDREDKELFEMAVKEADLNWALSAVNNGEQLMEALLKTAESGVGRLPSVIFLDLNMPVKDGREALKEIKSHEKLKKIPVIVYSTSNSPSDIHLTYESGANWYMVKPDTFDEQVEMVKLLSRLITNFVNLPN